MTGGTISGPAMFHLAECALWVLIIGMTGRSGVDAVTSNLSMTYLRRAPAGDVDIYADGDPVMVAHAAGTYAMPAIRTEVTKYHIKQRYDLYA